MIRTELVIDSNHMGIDDAINKTIKKIEDEGKYYIRDIKFSGDRALIIYAEFSVDLEKEI